MAPIAWLGEIAAALYLVHIPVISYIIWVNNNGDILTWPPDVNCDQLEGVEQTDCRLTQLDFALKRLPPSLWFIAANIFFSILAATIITYGFERPIQRYLRKYSTASSKAKSVRQQQDHQAKQTARSQA